MQTVSENWKNAHNQTLLNESFVEVSLDITDPDALADASPSDNGAIYISNSSELTDGVDKFPTPYCTLEQNLWVLNGGRKAIPETIDRSEGFVSDAMSDETCVFTDKIPTITIDFSKRFITPIPGVTITWSNTYNEFATEFIVRAYDDQYLRAEKEVIGNRSVKSLVMVDIPEYNRIVIYVKKWCLPHHRARVEEIFVGMNKVYARGDLFDYSHKHSVSPVSTSLPKNEIHFAIDNVAGEYNPSNEEGIAKYLMDRQEVKTRYGLKFDDDTIEWIKGGTFYLSEWFAKQNGLTAEFTARDLLEFMNADYTETHDLTSRSLYDLAEKLLIAAELPLNSNGTIKWHIDESLKSKYTTAPLPNDTLANCLQLIANAGQCAIYQDRSGTLRIEPLSSDDTDYTISSFNSYSKPEITLAKPMGDLFVKIYEYWVAANQLQSSSIPLRFPGRVGGEIITLDNPLITETQMALDVGQWMATHLKHRKTIDSSWRVDVRLDPLDIVTNKDSYNTNRVRMTNVEFKYNGAFRGTGEGKVI